ncbi:MAG: glycoside hydrolase family 97 protein [Bacteroidales bacterium]|nr:glycoside hydrolase family 97 protein [Bacteroidales bacterium]
MISISTAKAQEVSDAQVQTAAEATQAEMQAAAQDTTAAQKATDEAAEWAVTSPDGKLKLTVNVGQTIEWGLALNGRTLLDPSPISMTLTDGTVYGASGEYAVETTQPTPETAAERTTPEPDNNTLTLKFNDYDLIFKAFNNGVAYRFVSKSQVAFEVLAEQATFAFPEDWNLYVPYVRDKGTFEAQYFNSFENRYEHIPVSQWDPERLAFLPLLVEAADGVKLCITETDVTDYPGMYLHNGTGSLYLTGNFAKYPKKLEQGGHNMLQMVVKSREDYIAKYDAKPSPDQETTDQAQPAERHTPFPWRIVAVSTEDKDLLANDLPYRLAKPQAPETDFSWVRPGKVAWDWWNDWNLHGVDFKTGVNNPTYKHYIDFASQHGIEYVILDEGWAVNLQADLMQVVPEIDLEELITYAAERNVGIILWAGYWAFARDMENVCRHYSEMGVKGFKVDFMDRDDQIITRFERDAAAMAAKYHLVLDFHGTYKPVGLHREWPNVLNYEGVHGLEQMKWSMPDVDQVTYDVTIPYIRQLAGPMDYTQGAMRNATRENYRPVNTEPMSQGTRCRQLAEYVVFNSPLTMLCDSPSAYMAEPECLDYIANIPTVWDEIVPLAGEVGKYVAIAKRSGDKWYVGVMTDWTARDIEIDLNFLAEGSWNIETFADGANADRIARDYVKTVDTLETPTKITAHLAPGGGFVAILCK